VIGSAGWRSLLLWDQSPRRRALLLLLEGYS
jgi:hypothetical protein